MDIETSATEIIRKKRDGHPLDDREIRAFVAGVTQGTIPDYQAAAWLMAVFLQGMNDAEMASLADAMTHSGDVLDLSSIDRPKVDKHSTGGVGDKISLPLAAAVASCGAAVPMVSGRGLGHSGGTLDKLESISGFNVGFTAEQFIAQVDQLGVAMIGQTARLAPADRKLYALRDVTSTVECVPLIASSIMSKKLAEGIDALVLDCKVGQGAFMKTMDDARSLARAIQAIGRAADKAVTVMVTDMNTPIGRYVGNALEVVESIEVLRGGGPADTRELTVRLGGEMLRLTGLASDDADGATQIADALDSGRALQLFGEMVAAQGGDRSQIDNPESLPTAPHKRALQAPRAGYVHQVRAYEIGRAGMVLGAGRARKEDPVDPAVGLELCVRVGDKVDAGQDLAYLLYRDRGLERATGLAMTALIIDDQPPPRSEEPTDAPEATTDDADLRVASRIIEVLR